MWKRLLSNQTVQRCAATAGGLRTRMTHPRFSFEEKNPEKKIVRAETCKDRVMSLCYTSGI